MPREFPVPPVVFPSGATAATTTTTTSGSATSPPQNIQHRRPATAPFQPPPRPSSTIPFMSFDISSAAAGATTTTTTTAATSYPPLNHPHLFLDEPPLLDELEINPTLIWRKTKSILNPLRINSSLHDDPDLSGPFLFYIAFGLFQLLAGKVQFGVILGWIAISSIFVYSILNFLAGRNGNLDLYRCFSVVGYCLMPIVVFSAVALFVPVKGTVGLGTAGVFVAWATRVCSRLLAENAGMATLGGGGGTENVGLIAYPCFLIYSLFSLLVMF